MSKLSKNQKARAKPRTKNLQAQHVEVTTRWLSNREPDADGLHLAKCVAVAWQCLASDKVARKVNDREVSQKCRQQARLREQDPFKEEGGSLDAKDSGGRRSASMASRQRQTLFRGLPGFACHKGLAATMADSLLKSQKSLSCAHQ